MVSLTESGRQVVKENDYNVGDEQIRRSIEPWAQVIEYKKKIYVFLVFPLIKHGFGFDFKKVFFLVETNL